MSDTLLIFNNLLLPGHSDLNSEGEEEQVPLLEDDSLGKRADTGQSRMAMRDNLHSPERSVAPRCINVDLLFSVTGCEHAWRASMTCKKPGVDDSEDLILALEEPPVQEEIQGERAGTTCRGEVSRAGP